MTDASTRAPDAPRTRGGGVSPAAMALTDAYRPIRWVEPPQSPVAGVLAAAGDRRVVLADAVATADRVFAAREDAPQHLLAPADVVRRGDGHDFELPWCRERLSRLLAARAANRGPLGGGELVTVVVSLLRGVREAWQDVPPEAEGPRGEWWIDGQGRPLFARGAADADPVATAAGAVLTQAVEHTRDRVLLRLLEEARAALERPRSLGRVAPRLEDALFEACAPRPIAPAEERAGEPRAAGPTPVVEPARAGTAVAGAIERLADAGLADAVVDAVERIRASLARGGRGSRRAPLVAGGAVAAFVLAAGLMWQVEPDPAQPRAAAPEASASPTAAGPRASEAPPTSAPGAEDPVAATERLLDELAECAAHGDPLCRTIRDESAEPLPDDALAAASGATEIALLDDYGDIAVLRVDDPAGARGSVLLQLVRVEGRWLLRAANVMSSPG